MVVTPMVKILVYLIERQNLDFISKLVQIKSATLSIQNIAVLSCRDLQNSSTGFKASQTASWFNRFL